MFQDLISQQFFEAMADCRRIYVDQSIDAAVLESNLSGAQRLEYLDDVEFRFTRLVIKVFVEVAWSDCVWSEGEGRIAVQMLEELLRTSIPPKKVQASLRKLLQINSQTSWQSVLQPFTELDELIDQRPILESGLMRMANIFAKIDGKVTDETMGQLKNLRWQLHQFLDVPDPEGQNFASDVDKVIAAFDDAFQDPTRSSNAFDYAAAATAVGTSETRAEVMDAGPVPVSEPVSEESSTAAEIQIDALIEAVTELDVLIGIDAVKSEVKGLVNFLKVESARTAAGLPKNQISLHMVFEGNPGTGKTTVARILGRIFGAMGVLKKGHLIETDRSGLVAEFAGQTATKANRMIDSALDGVLFIDEAYSLVNDAKDSYGAEAMQILLKRAEDDRDRLIVIMAGYNKEMEELLLTNPGLSSRFARTFEFPDYTTDELSQIFSVLAEKHHYAVPADARRQLDDILTEAVRTKDDHFGNGRLVRNIFEKSIRNLADRVVNAGDLTPEVLTTFESSDIELA